jgi:molybdenum cofactor cytidylyltransferase
LKIIPYAVPVTVLDKALSIAHGQPILDIQPLPARRVALLITGERAAQPLLRAQFEPAIRQRLEFLGSTLATVISTTHEEVAVATTIQPLLATHDLLIIAGQTSIMDEHDPVLDALRDQGAAVILHGAPVDPGNLLALADFAGKPILCAPGCARSMAPNVVDLILPRLLVGEQLTELHIAQMGLGGLLR